MKGDIWDNYPSSKSQPNRSSNGGKVPERDVMGYAQPYGPTNLGNRGPGLGGTNCGNGQCPGKAMTSGFPGLGGRNLTNSGSQGKR